MKPAMGAVIRQQRQALKLTQEQLAEACGVSVGAVSKWENDTTTPDLGTVVSLAELFGVSTDVLLGHTLQSGGPNEWAERIKRLTGEKQYEQGQPMVEQALLRWPNHLNVLFYSANYYASWGAEHHNSGATRRGLELFERSLPLANQSEDEHINEAAISYGITLCYLNLGETEQALRLLKRHNGNGVNSHMIGALLVEQRKFEEARIYLSEAMLERGSQIVEIAAGLAACLDADGDYAEAYGVLTWAHNMLQELELPGQNSPLLYIRAWLLILRAGVQANFIGDLPLAEKLLRQAVDAARRFDADPVFTPKGIRFYRGSGREVATFGSGLKAMEMLQSSAAQPDTLPALKELWERVMKDET